MKIALHLIILVTLSFFLFEIQTSAQVMSPNKPPVAKFTATKKHLQTGQTTSFKDHSKHDPTSWYWIFNGATPSFSTEQDPEDIAYNQPGVYDVTLIVSNELGADTLTKYNYITVSGTIPQEPPIANFCASSTEIETGDEVDFYDMSLNEPEEWFWVFQGGEPAFSTEEEPYEVIFNLPGVYDITLIASNEYGSDTLFREGYITVTASDTLNAEFTADQTEIIVGEVVHFSDLSTGNPVFWIWEIEGASPSISYQQNPVVIFNTPGIFSVKLTAQKAGATDIEIKDAYITVDEGNSFLPPGWEYTGTSQLHVIAIPPVANPNIGGIPLEPGDHIGVFYSDDNNELKCGGAEIWTGESTIAIIAYGDDSFTSEKDGFFIGEAFTWKIYDWSRAREVDAFATYDMALPYQGEFMHFGTSALGSLYTIDADFTADKTEINVGDVVHFSDLSIGNPAFWIWQIEGASPSISYQHNPVVIFNTPGVFSVTLTAYYAGATDIETKEGFIIVNEVPVVIPPGWEYNSTSQMHVIAIPLEANPNISGMPLEPGDHIGVFYSDDTNQLRCGGTDIWNGESNIAIIAFGDDPFTTEKDGFHTGEKLIWKVYNWSSEQEYDAFATYDASYPCQGHFSQFGTSAITSLYTIDADFTADLTEIFEGEIVHFTDLSTGDPSFWIWEIEGASPSISYQHNPVVIFNTPGIFSVTLTAYYAGATDVETKEDFIIVNADPVILPPGWEHNSTSQMHVVAVPLEAFPNILGAPLEPGDHIGVFYMDENNGLTCGGAEIWNGENNIAVFAYADNSYTSEKDGFLTGDEFIWKVYNWSDEVEYNAQVTYDETLPCQGNFTPFGTSALTSLVAAISFNVTIPSGWSGISSPVVPLNPELITFLEPLTENLIMMNNFSGVFWPEMGINTLLIWNNRTGYNIKLENPVELAFFGGIEDEITLSVKEGWGFLPVPVMCEVNIQEILSAYIEDVVIVREISGSKVFWPAYNIYTLTELTPGEAYLIQAADNFELPFPSCENQLKSSPSHLSLFDVTVSDWDIAVPTNSMHTIAFSGDVLNELTENDIVGVFTSDGQCVGLEQFTGDAFAITAFGDDITTPEKDGLDENEQFVFRLYKETEDEMYDLEVDYDFSMPNSGLFSNNGISAVNQLKIMALEISEAGGINCQISPNPTDGMVKISTTQHIKKIVIRAVSGKQVMSINPTETNTIILDLSSFERGLYLMQLYGDARFFSEKIVLN
nr:T9SS type A sorting domain-containing protein [Bacteroidota bacterium]